MDFDNVIQITKTVVQRKVNSKSKANHYANDTKITGQITLARFDHFQQKFIVQN